MTDDHDEGQRPPRRLTPMEGADVLAQLLMLERETLIFKLRRIDRLLGRPQTVPERER